jgi:two-component system chemotaxis response regulator CheY
MSRKVLIVDNSKAVRDVIETTLAEAGYDVCSAECSQTALNLVEDKHYDLLMTDLNMPQMDGLEFISEVRKIPGRRFLPIVVLSSEEKQKRFVDCVKAGASGYLEKPLDEEQIRSIMQTIIPY